MTSIGPLRNSPGIREIIGMRAEFDRLQLQLSTGKRAQDYAGLGVGRAPSLDARAKLDGIEGFRRSIAEVDLRLKTLTTTFEGFGRIISEQRATNIETPFVPVDGGQSAAQKTARSHLEEVLGLLNADVGGRQLFSGRATDRAATRNASEIIDGVAPAAGLRQVIDERVRADRGLEGLGRLALSAQGASPLTLSETNAGPFGFKITGAAGPMSNAQLADMVGPPRSIAVDLTGQPAVGEAITISLQLPDGRPLTTRLSATDGPPGESEFRIGATPAATLDNFRSALEADIRRKVNRDLMPSSTMVAAEGFFSGSATTPPTRVDVVGQPETATSLRSATPTDTVVWYTGEAGTDDPRATSVARVDDGVTVGYGLRANEPAFRNLVANLAAFSVATFDPASPDTQDAFRNLAMNVRERLGDTSGQSVRSVMSEIAVAHMATKSATERHDAKAVILGELLDDVEGIDQNEVAAKLLQLQTRLEASYRTTSIVSQLSLVNFMG